MSKPPRTSPEGTAASPTTIVLVRHGVTPTTGKVLPGRAAGLHLSETGRAQAKAVAGGFTGAPGEDHQLPIAALYASPLERAQETAEAIAEATGVAVQTEPDLVDLDTGDWTGLELATAYERPEWRVIQRHPSGFRFPGGESFVEMQARMLTTIQRLRTRHAGGTVVAVSHGDPIAALAAHALGTHLDLFQRVIIAPCSVTAIAYGEHGPAVLTVNAPDTTPLTPS